MTEYEDGGRGGGVCWGQGWRECEKPQEGLQKGGGGVKKLITDVT